MKLYHGTSARHLNKILRHGIKPRGSKSGNWDHSVLSHPDAVYMTSAYALYYALTASNGKAGVIIEIDTDKLNPFKLCPDEDFLAHATRKRFGDKSLNEVVAFYRDDLERYAEHWQDSIDHMGNCCYLDHVPVEAITRYALIGNSSEWIRWSDPTISIMNFKIMGDYYRALSKMLFGDPVDYVDDGHGFYRLPPPEQLAKVKVVTLPQKEPAL